MGMTAAFNTEGKRTAPLRPSNLQFDKVILHSSTGVQQGDPLGPLLFAAGVQLLAAGLRASPVDFTSFYLDDGVLAGSVDSVATALAQLQQASATIGLSLNLTKSEAIAVGATPGAALTAKLPPNLLTTLDGEIRTLRNFEFLGAGIGDPAYLQAHAAAYLQAHAAARVEATRMLLDAIGRLEDPPVALRLLRASAGFGRLMHTMRCCPPAGHAAALDTSRPLGARMFQLLHRAALGACSVAASHTWSWPCWTWPSPHQGACPGSLLGVCWCLCSTM